MLLCVLAPRLSIASATFPGAAVHAASDAVATAVAVGAVVAITWYVVILWVRSNPITPGAFPLPMRCHLACCGE